MDGRNLSDRYQNDPAFHALVELFRNQIEAHDFTPTEIREAALWAAILYEYEYVRPLIKYEVPPIHNKVLDAKGYSSKKKN